MRESIGVPGQLAIITSLIGPAVVEVYIVKSKVEHAVIDHSLCDFLNLLLVAVVKGALVVTTGLPSVPSQRRLVVEFGHAKCHKSS